jgi:Flp pilus assembly protein TadD
VPDRIREGLALVDSLAAEDPANALLLLARATGLQRLQRFDEAEKELRRAIEMDPSDWRLHQALGDLLMATDRQKEAGPIMKQAGELRVKSLKK